MALLSLPDGRKIYFKARGSGKSLLLIHGWGTSSQIWENQLAHFSKNYKTIILDLAGHGQSSHTQNGYSLDLFAEDLLFLLNTLKIEKVNLAGWSMGALVAIKLFQKNQNRVESLILISATPRFVANYEFGHGLQPLIIKKLQKDIKQDYQKAMDNFINLIFKGENSPPPLVPDYPGQEVSLQTLELLEKADLRNCLEEINLPTLLIHGEKDEICFPKASEFMAKKIKKSSLKIMPQVSHAPFLTQTAKFNNMIVEFLK